MKKQISKNVYLDLVSSHENYMDCLRENINTLKSYYGWSVRVLAEKADISDDTLNSFLHGKARDCNLSMIVKLARAFNVSMDELTGAETIEKNTRECMAMSRVMPDYVRYLNRSFVKHQYKIHSEFAPDTKNIPVFLPECINGYMQTTNVTTTVCIDKLPAETKNRICLGLQIPCEHYEPFYMPNEILLLSVDRAGLNNERCVVSYKGNYFIAIKKIRIENSEKKVKYLSLIDGKTEVLPSQIDDKIGYVVGFLNPDGTWGVR